MKKNKYDVSIVIPCYNAEDYIVKTLDSICNQSFDNYEVICVNDGSTDGTLDILNEYSKKYSFFSVISKKNDKGATTIRVGLEKVKGNYVCVIDNDDYVSTNYIEELYNTIKNENADIAVCGFQRENFVTKKVLSKEMNKKQESIVLKDDYGKLLEINTSLWNKMFKADLIKTVLTEKRLFGMDMIYLAYMYANTKKIAFTDKVLYFYQIRQQSSINTLRKEYIMNVYDSLLIVKKFYKKNAKDMLDFLNSYAFLHVGVSLTYRMLKNDNFEYMFNENVNYLNNNFPLWLKNKYCSLTYIICSRGRNFKLFICKFFYKIRMFKLFLRIYDFIINKFKFEIKW